MMKKLSIFILICVLIGSALAVYASYFLKPLLEEKIFEAVEGALGRGLEIAEIDLSLTESTIFFRGIKAEDCRFIKYGNAISADEVTIDVNVPFTLLQRIIVLEEVSLKNLTFGLSNRKKLTTPDEYSVMKERDAERAVSEDATASRRRAFRSAGPGGSFSGLRVDKVVIEDSRFRFSDHRARPSTNVIEIADLNGHIDALSFSTERGGLLDGAVFLKGLIKPNGNGSFKLNGSFAAAQSGLDFDLCLDLENVSLTIFEPYYSKTSLTILKEAKIGLESQAHCSQNNLNAFQTVRIYDIELNDIKPQEGDRLFGLPAKTVIEFFENSKRDIEFSFNVSGTITDPKFEAGPVIQQVLSKALQDQIMAKLQELPGKMLKRAIGSNILGSSGVSMPSDEEIEEALDKVETKIKKIMMFKP